MRASIVWLFATGCGVFGGPNIEGDWSGECNTEDENDRNFDFDVSMTFEKEEKDRASGEGDFETTIDEYTYNGYVYGGDLSGDSDDLEANESDGRWEIDGEFELDQASDSVDMELTADVDGDDMTGDVTFDFGSVEVSGDCTFNRE
jgi:hypothetical protein